MNRFLGIIAAIIGINLVVTLHEFGHFSACKLFGVRVPVFSIGFDPAIASYRIGQTDYQIGAIPLGGYVAPNEADLQRQSLPKKLIIILAGIAANILLAFAIFVYLKNKNQKNQEHENTEQEELAQERNLEQEPIGEKVTNLIREATPEEAKPILESLRGASFIGPIGIISLISQGLQKSFDTYLYFIALVSLNLGLLNLLPIPMLDGGQAVKAIFQSLNVPSFGGGSSGSWVTIIIFVLFILFILYSSVKDILRLRKK